MSFTVSDDGFFVVEDTFFVVDLVSLPPFAVVAPAESSADGSSAESPSGSVVLSASTSPLSALSAADASGADVSGVSVF